MFKLLARLLGRDSKIGGQWKISQEKREELQLKLGYQFHSHRRLTEALTHRSFLHESEGVNSIANERLEFLGDSVLGLIVAEELFREHPHMSEGELTKNRSLLVNRKSLAYAGSQIDLGDFVLLSAVEARTGGRHRESIVADCVEALIGAVYQDGGLESARKVVRRLISFDFRETRQALSLRNYKGDLLELLQGRGGDLPKYHVVHESGPDHQKTFTVEVLVADQSLGRGKGESKKSAEQKAAKIALQAIRSNDKKTGWTEDENHSLR